MELRIIDAIDDIPICMPFFHSYCDEFNLVGQLFMSLMTKMLLYQLYIYNTSDRIIMNIVLMDSLIFTDININVSEL